MYTTPILAPKGPLGYIGWKLMCIQSAFHIHGFHIFRFDLLQIKIFQGRKFKEVSRSKT